MLFKCKNCGGNAVYSPEKETLYCPHCESLDSEEKISGSGMTQCVNCGAPLEPETFTSAMKCPHCGSYLIFEERVEGDYTPHLILPFKIGKEKAVEAIRKEFHKRTFVPSSFLSEASIEEMEGMYVPFFMYDYDCDAYYSALGTKVRKWTTGETEYTETSYYQVVRDMEISFDKVPVDASEEMPDDVMDLMEPYDYQALTAFQEKYMSGFNSEVYNFSSEEMEKRAKKKTRNDATSLLHDTLKGYTTLTQVDEQISLNLTKTNYALLPVWVYKFRYRENVYDFYVNGQTGKVIGQTPVSYPKVAGYSTTVFGITMAIGLILKVLAEVM
ncbi:MAG: hypothetical protein PUB13_07380 [Lachnospiraceae bacterium]|nr:hypothetical protein [Lachnospiraceae bacterium]